MREDRLGKMAKRTSYYVHYAHAAVEGSSVTALAGLYTRHLPTLHAGHLELIASMQLGKQRLVHVP